MDRKITVENLKNAKNGETIETPRGRFKVELHPYSIFLFKNGEIVSRDYLSDYRNNDGYEAAWERLYNHLVKWLNWELCY